MSEVASLDPHPAAIPTRGGVEPPLRGKPQPGLQREMLTAFVEVAIKHQKFAAVRNIERNRSVRGPALHPHLLAAVTEQQSDLNTRPTLGMRIRECLSIEAHWCSVLQIELPQLDEEHAARRGAWALLRGRPDP